MDLECSCGFAFPAYGPWPMCFLSSYKMLCRIFQVFKCQNASEAVAAKGTNTERLPLEGPCLLALSNITHVPLKLKNE